MKIRNAFYLNNSYLLLITILFILSSCGAHKKVSSGYSYGTSSTKKSGVLTDASDARDVSGGKNKLEGYAEILGVSSRELDNKDLYYTIDDWMGTPHRTGGLDKRGVDCSGFVGMMYRTIYHKDLPRTSRDMADKIKMKSEKQLKEGDLVFFSFAGRNIDHVGIYLHNDKFVHVSTRKGVIISSLKDAWYSKYFVRCGTPST